MFHRMMNLTFSLHNILGAIENMKNLNGQENLKHIDSNWSKELLKQLMKITLSLIN